MSFQVFPLHCAARDDVNLMLLCTVVRNACLDSMVSPQTTLSHASDVAAITTQTPWRRISVIAAMEIVLIVSTILAVPLADDALMVTMGTL